MSDMILDQLKAVGVAHVIVELKPSLVRPGGAARFAAAVWTARSRSRRPVHDARTTFHLLGPEPGELSGPRQRTRSDTKNDRFRTTSPALFGAAVPDLRPAQLKLPPKMRIFPNLGLLFGAVDRTGLKALRADERVATVTAAPPVSLIRPMTARLAEPRGVVTWGLERLGIPELWTEGLTGAGILVGHLDTGVDGDHPALKDAIGEFAEFDAIGNAVANAKPHDTGEHGTHTAGTIAGRKVSSTAFGVAPGAKLASAIVIEGGQVIARILAGMDWAVGHGIRILSMSLGLRGYHEDFLPLIRGLRARGVLPIFAIGNEGPGTSRSPGNYAEVLSVGACARDETVPAFSSSQRFLRKGDARRARPGGTGVGVMSCVPGGNYAEMDGSSMATPHIAGLAALLFEAAPAATIDQVEAAILGSCTLPKTMDAERANRGVPNALALSLY